MINNTLYASGQLGLDPATGDFVEGGVPAQTEQAFKNIRAILAEAGMTIDNVVKATYSSPTWEIFAAMNRVCIHSAEIFPPGLPSQ